MNINQDTFIRIGDRVKGQEHRCGGNHYLCDRDRCRKFGGFVIDVSQIGISLQGYYGETDNATITVEQRWVRTILPEIEHDADAVNVMGDLIKLDSTR